MYDKFEKVANTWIKELDNYTMEELLRQPAEDSWSLGQVYIHITTANKYFLGKNAAMLASGEGFETGKGKNKWGHLVFLFEMFPPVKVKMPKKETGGTEPIQPESKEQLVRKLQENLAFFKEMEDSVAKAPLNQTKKYPFLGYLNAKEWYVLGRLHMKHHLKQKKRIDAFLGK